MKRFLMLFGSLLSVLFFVGSVHAGGTIPGTAITNQATATYGIGATTGLTSSSNTTTTTVAELLDVNVTWQDATNVTVNPGDTNQVLTFQITNTGNGSDTYSLAGLSTPLGGDDFDPTLVDVYLDSNGNGTYDPGTDTQYILGTNDPSLVADASLIVFVVNDIPLALADGDIGNSQLTVTSTTATGAGTKVPGGGDSGSDLIVGTSGGEQSFVGTYVVSNVVVSVVKSAVVVSDPLGNTDPNAEPVPGAVISYSIVVTVTGSGTAESVVITDVIPASTTYNDNSLLLNSAPLTDATGDDAGDVSDTDADTRKDLLTVNLGNLTSASPVQTVSFSVTID